MDFATAYCNADAELLSDIALCVSEAAANVVAHAYADSSGELSLTVSRAQGMLVVVISDAGVGTSAQTARPGLGIGMKIVEALSDATFEPLDGSGLRVTMRFPCASR